MDDMNYKIKQELENLITNIKENYNENSKNIALANTNALYFL